MSGRRGTERVDRAAHPSAGGVGRLSGSWNDVPRSVRSALPLLAALAAAFAYPYIVDDLRNLGIVGDFFPQLGSLVIILVFTMMALGLNVVVGYAGLLDLGYVAFYAVGAYTRAASRRGSSQGSVHFGDGGNRARGRRHPHLRSG